MYRCSCIGGASSFGVRYAMFTGRVAFIVVFRDAAVVAKSSLMVIAFALFNA